MLVLLVKSAPEPDLGPPGRMCNAATSAACWRTTAACGAPGTTASRWRWRRKRCHTFGRRPASSCRPARRALPVCRCVCSSSVLLVFPSAVLAAHTALNHMYRTRTASWYKPLSIAKCTVTILKNSQPLHNIVSANAGHKGTASRMQSSASAVVSVVRTVCRRTTWSQRRRSATTAGRRARLTCCPASRSSSASGARPLRMCGATRTRTLQRTARCVPSSKRHAHNSQD